MVCKHCPVFDTVAMLSIHRQGKKHLASKLFYEPNEQTLVRDSSIQPQNGQFRIFVKSHILYLGIILFIITAITDLKIYILKDNGRPHTGHFCSHI